MQNSLVYVKTEQKARKEQYRWMAVEDVLKQTCVHEVFEGDNVVKPCFDVDVVGKSAFASTSAYVAAFKAECDLIFPRCRYAIAARLSSEKLSLHISLPNYSINRFAMAKFAKQFTVPGVDGAIYRSRLHSLRLPWSEKDGRTTGARMAILEGSPVDFVNQFWAVEPEFDIREAVEEGQASKQQTRLVSRSVDEYLAPLNLRCVSSGSSEGQAFVGCEQIEKAPDCALCGREHHTSNNFKVDETNDRFVIKNYSQQCKSCTILKNPKGAEGAAFSGARQVIVRGKCGSGKTTAVLKHLLDKGAKVVLPCPRVSQKCELRRKLVEVLGVDEAEIGELGEKCDMDARRKWVLTTFESLYKVNAFLAMSEKVYLVLDECQQLFATVQSSPAPSQTRQQSFLTLEGLLQRSIQTFFIDPYMTAATINYAKHVDPDTKVVDLAGELDCQVHFLESIEEFTERFSSDVHNGVNLHLHSDRKDFVTQVHDKYLRDVPDVVLYTADSKPESPRLPSSTRVLLTSPAISSCTSLEEQDIEVVYGVKCGNHNTPFDFANALYRCRKVKHIFILDLNPAPKVDPFSIRQRMRDKLDARDKHVSAVRQTTDEDEFDLKQLSHLMWMNYLNLCMQSLNLNSLVRSGAFPRVEFAFCRDRSAKALFDTLEIKMSKATTLQKDLACYAGNKEPIDFLVRYLNRLHLDADNQLLAPCFSLDDSVRDKILNYAKKFRLSRVYSVYKEYLRNVTRMDLDDFILDKKLSAIKEVLNSDCHGNGADFYVRQNDVRTLDERAPGWRQALKRSKLFSVKFDKSGPAHPRDLRLANHVLTNFERRGKTFAANLEQAEDAALKLGFKSPAELLRFVDKHSTHVRCNKEGHTLLFAITRPELEPLLHVRYNVDPRLVACLNQMRN